MKKALAILTMCAITNPVMTAHATTKSKHHHKKKHHVALTEKKSFKDTAAAPAATKDTTPAWLSNVSGSFALTSNYMFRGISLSQDNPAAQGGLTYTFPIGLYFNVWGSSANFTVPNGKTATSEIDTIVGVHNTIGDNFTYDINMDRYNYPGARYGNYNELNTLFTYKVFQLGVSYSSNYSGTHGRGLYTNGTLTFNIPPAYIFNFQDVSVLGEFGHYALAKIAGNSYNDFSLGVNKKISNTYSLSLLGTGTNGHAKQPPYDGNQIVGTVNAVF